MKYAPQVLKSIKGSNYNGEGFSVVSNEGIFDAFVKFIKGYNKDSPGEEKDGRELYSFNWVQEQEKEIKNTFGNPGWVKANYHETPTKLPENAAADLSYKGKVLKPAEGLSKGIAMVDKFLSMSRPLLVTYREALIDLEKDAIDRIDNGEDSVAVAKDTLKKVKSVKHPFDANFFYDDLIGNHILSFKRRQRLPGGDIPPLTLEDVIAGGKALSEVTKSIANCFNRTVLAGVGCDDGIWLDTPGFDVNSNDSKLEYIASELHDHFYYQQLPDDFVHFQYEAIYGYAEYAREVGRWLQAYTR